MYIMFLYLLEATIKCKITCYQSSVEPILIIFLCTHVNTPKLAAFTIAILGKGIFMNIAVPITANQNILFILLPYLSLISPD